MSVQVTCAIIEKDGKVLVTQRSAAMSLPLKWEFPGGKLEEGEDPRSCIIREILEELSLDIKVVEKLEPVSHQYQNKIVVLIPFICRIISGELQLHEHADSRWCSAKELSELDWAEADIGVVKQWLL